MKKLLLIALLFIASCGPLPPTFETNGGTYQHDNIDLKVEVEQTSENSWFEKYQETSGHKTFNTSIKTAGILPTSYTGPLYGYRIVSKKRYKSQNQSFTLTSNYLRLHHLTRV